MKELKPSPRYMTRLRVVISFWAVIILMLGILSAGLVSLDAHYTRQATIILQVVMISDFTWYLLAIWGVRASYEARTYYISEEEIIIETGWLTKSNRHILLNCVIEIETRWDRLDRWLEIGTLDVLTVAGRKGKYSRVRLVGLADVEMAARLISRQLQRLRDENLAKWSSPGESPEHTVLNLRHQI